MSVLAAATGLVLLPALAGCGAQDGASAAGVPATASPATTAAAVTEPAADPAPAPATDDRVGLPCPDSQLDATATPGGLPGVTLPCLGPGPDVNLAGLRGTPTVINVWASWCVPCRHEMPMLTALAHNAGDQLQVLGVDVLDDRAAGMQYAADANIASIYDAKGITRAPLGWTGPPLTIFVNADGAIVHRTIGAYPSADRLHSDVAEYLGVQVPQ